MRVLRPHPEEPPIGRVSKDEASELEHAPARLKARAER
jgi:hypothetical protein